MLKAEEARENQTLLIDGKIYKVVGIQFGGAAKAGRLVHLKLKGIPDGRYQEMTFHGNDLLNEVSLERYEMEFLYSDGENFYFMNTQTYEQFPIRKEMVDDKFTPYLKENTKIQVEFFGEEPVNILFPKIMELKVISTPEGIHETETSTYKEAILENGLKILVPQFTKPGDLVRVEVPTGRYLDRVKR